MMGLTQSELIGSIGVAMLLVAFALNLFEKLGRDSVAYGGLNTVGAGLAAYASWIIEFWPFVVLEGTWMVVSALATVKALKATA